MSLSLSVSVCLCSCLCPCPCPCRCLFLILFLCLCLHTYIYIYLTLCLCLYVCICLCHCLCYCLCLLNVSVSCLDFLSIKPRPMVYYPLLLKRSIFSFFLWCNRRNRTRSFPFSHQILGSLKTEHITSPYYLSHKANRAASFTWLKSLHRWVSWLLHVLAPRRPLFCK